MVNDAKKYEGEDKEKREIIDLQNQSEQLIYQTEKNLDEYKDKLDKNEKKTIEDAVEKLKSSKDAKNLEDLKLSFEELNTAWNVVASKMYEAAKEEGPIEEESTGSKKNKKKTKAKAKNESEIEDADFEVVD